MRFRLSEPFCPQPRLPGSTFGLNRSYRAYASSASSLGGKALASFSIALRAVSQSSLKRAHVYGLPIY